MSHVEEQQGVLDVVNFDRAILECLGASLIPNAAGSETGPNFDPSEDLGFGLEGRDPTDDPNCKLSTPRRQAEIPGVEGTGNDGSVYVIMNTPEDIYNRYMLPGIRVHRTSIENDENRRMGHLAGYKYRIPSNNGKQVEVNGQVGHTSYVTRMHAEPLIIIYDIEVRARAQLEAQQLRRYVSRRIRDRMFVPVYDSIGTPSTFTIFRDSIVETSQFLDTLNRHHGYMMTYRLQAEIDDYDEVEVRALTSLPVVRGGQINEG